MRNNLKISTIAVLAAMLVAGSASAATVTVGGNGGLLGGGGGGSTVDAGVNTGVDLGGTDQPNSANINLGGTGGTSGDVLLDLFGDGGTNGSVAVNTGSNGVGAVSTDPIVLDLFGNGDDGANGTNGINGTNGNGSNVTINGAGVRVVAARANGKCFAPNAAQIEKLANRHTYGDATLNGWAGANRLRVIDVGLCKNAGVTISGNANVDRLQSLVAGNAGLMASLSKSGRSANEVIAVDKNGQTLTVYVM